MTEEETETIKNGGSSNSNNKIIQIHVPKIYTEAHGKGYLIIIEDESAPDDKPKKYIVLAIIPDPADEYFDDIFVKDYALKGEPEPAGYNQAIGLEYRYPYVKRVRVSTGVITEINKATEYLQHKIRQQKQKQEKKQKDEEKN